MKAISKSAVVIFCFAVLPGVSAFASPSGNQDRDEDKQEINVANFWWFQATWLLPPRVGDDVSRWLDKTLDNGMDWYTDSAEPKSEDTGAKSLGVIIQKGVMSGNPG